MYPRIYAQYFRDFETTSEVFVALPSTAEGDKRWSKIFQPAIRSLDLQPFRVTERTVSDSILTDILSGIGRAALVLADVTFQTASDRPPGPNPNVLYELGLAHAMRLPEEVVVVRGDSLAVEPPFDISHIRYQKFDQARAKKSVAKIRTLLSQSLQSLDRTRDEIVQRTLRSLDPDQMRFLHTVRGSNAFDLALFDPNRNALYGLGHQDTTEEHLRALARSLTGLGVLAAGDPGKFKKRVYGATPEYRLTKLGAAVVTKLPPWLATEGA